ncbi:hypothetical protein [Psychrobacillus sp. L3]|uniref:hypothetical protein n=1 Tax=Psychrobacillus sp. L3 TaxID=3236891 RepID=UPI0036F2075A
MKKLFIICLIALGILSACENTSNESTGQISENLQNIAFNSLTDMEKKEIENKEKAEIQKIEEVPENTDLVINDYDKNNIYSVKFKSTNQDLGDIVVFVDNVNKKTIGILLRK